MDGSDANTNGGSELIKRMERIERKLDEIRQLIGPFGAAFPNNEILVQTLFENKYFVDANDLVMTPQLVVYRQWEAELSRFFVALASIDTVFVDIGANFGYFTCLVGSRISANGGGRVIAVEPNPKMFELLSKNIQINWSMCPVETHHCAITQDGQSIDLVIPVGGAANAHIHTGAEIAPNAAFRLSHVRGNTVDRIICGRRVTLMKIDVEGYELHVLQGARETIRNNPDICIVMEWSMPQMWSAKIDPQSVVQLLDELGLAPYRLPQDANIWGDAFASGRFTPDALMATPYDNIVVRRPL